MYTIKENSYTTLKETIKEMEEGLRNMAMVEVCLFSISMVAYGQMSKTDEKNREKQEKLRELSERDRQLAVIRVSRVVKALDKSYV